jgi:hypothetical protein
MTKVLNKNKSEEKPLNRRCRRCIAHHNEGKLCTDCKVIKHRLQQELNNEIEGFIKVNRKIMTDFIYTTPTVPKKGVETNGN